MPSIPQRLYNQVMMLDHFTCVYCGKRTPDVQIDHLIPQVLGGPDVLANLVAACPKCNMSKNDRRLDEINSMPSHGRFERQARKLRKFQPRPPVEIIRDPRPLEELAMALNDRGEYLYSKSRITRMVGGRKITVWHKLRALRGE